MTQTIIPLRPRGGRQSLLARIDTVASQILNEGRAMDLNAALMEAILIDLRAQRDQMAMVLADLRLQGPTGNHPDDSANARLIMKIDQGIMQIDLFIARAGLLDRKATPVQSNISAQPPVGA